MSIALPWSEFKSYVAEVAPECQRPCARPSASFARASGSGSTGGSRCWSRRSSTASPIDPKSGCRSNGSAVPARRVAEMAYILDGLRALARETPPVPSCSCTPPARPRPRAGPVKCSAGPATSTRSATNLYLRRPGPDGVSGEPNNPHLWELKSPRPLLRGGCGNDDGLREDRVHRGPRGQSTWGGGHGRAGAVAGDPSAVP